LSGRLWPLRLFRRRPSRSSRRSVGWEKELQGQLEELKEELGIRPDLDLAARMFCPSIPHEEMPDVEGEFNVYRIKVDGIVVRYMQALHSIRATVEGDLPQTTVEALTSDLVDKISALENAGFDLRKISGSGYSSVYAKDACRADRPSGRIV